MNTRERTHYYTIDQFVQSGSYDLRVLRETEVVKDCASMLLREAPWLTGERSQGTIEKISAVERIS